MNTRYTPGDRQPNCGWGGGWCIVTLGQDPVERGAGRNRGVPQCAMGMMNMDGERDVQTRPTADGTKGSPWHTQVE